ncbi:GHKL domain-containing protein [Butyrivibrio sp. YAB3001]|uniref:GHKL domain-containing protein n=1 Tax=Butyrivibrio sp. YAB3001 TaxID=1520812 RepID=UPI0008F66D7E|nr:GHKL domain-containing protein [Butyrivibrio sp. YAB3001]SFC13611.1 GHKL domain-containing protein [Butyrivibrio sp. YAB3001]
MGKKSAINDGIGLRSVQNLVKTQNGEMNISVDNELFIVKGNFTEYFKCNDCGMVFPYTREK